MIRIRIRIRMRGKGRSAKKSHEKKEEQGRDEYIKKGKAGEEA